MLIYKTIDDDQDKVEIIDFLKKNKATKEQISLTPPAATYIAAIKENKIVGVIGKNGKRLKQFYIKKELRGKGLGGKLLKLALDGEKEHTAFSTLSSRSLFLKNDFKIESILKNNICFMRRRKTK